MTPIRETIARAILDGVVHHGGHPINDPYVSPEPGLDCVMIDGLCNLHAAADAVLRALDEAGMVVVATDPVSEARRGLEWFERTFGVPLGDMPGREDVERVRAMISASVVE